MPGKRVSFPVSCILGEVCGAGGERYACLVWPRPPNARVPPTPALFSRTGFDKLSRTRCAVCSGPPPAQGCFGVLAVVALAGCAFLWRSLVSSSGLDSGRISRDPGRVEPVGSAAPGRGSSPSSGTVAVCVIARRADDAAGTIAGLAGSIDPEELGGIFGDGRRATLLLYVATPKGKGVAAQVAARVQFTPSAQAVAEPRTDQTPPCAVSVVPSQSQLSSLKRQTELADTHARARRHKHT